MGISVTAFVYAALLVLAPLDSQDRPALGSIVRDTAPATSPVVPAARTEQEWIVRDVAVGIQQMVAAVTSEGTAASPDLSVKTLPPAVGALARFAIVPGQTIAITDHLWSPTAYVPLAAALASHTPRCGAEHEAPVIAAMLQPVARVMAEENARISGRLQADMLCADAHHEAALLLGSFALREAAGGFSDPRRVISRMTAHLAIADALDDTAAAPRRLADAVLLTLVGRQKSALERLSALEPTASTSVRSWIRALRLRNTFDWRLLPDPENATLLEQLALMRATVTSLGDRSALAIFDRFKEPADIPDWVRLLTENNPSVATGNRFTKYWTSAEFAEAAATLGLMESGRAFDTREAISRELNAEQASGPVGAKGIVQVIDWGMWAAAAQRHVMASLVAQHGHLVDALGLPGDARSFRDDVSRDYSALRLYPLAAAALASNRDDAARSVAAAGMLIRNRPELVTEWVWKRLHAQAAYAVTPSPRGANTWFTPIFPAGTVFDVHVRLNGRENEPRFSMAEIADLRRLAPYSRRLIFGTVRWKGEKPSYEALRDEFGNMASYDVGFARTLASAAWDRPEIYVPLMEEACRMSPDAYWDLAPYLADRGRIDEARQAYERWLAEGRDEVAISGSMMWLVRFYFVRGELHKATALAERVADTGSFWGVVTRASLHEWRGDREAAERDHRRAWRRYDNPNELLGFYLRHGREGPEVDELLHEVFPTGVTRGATPPVGSAPSDGALIVHPGALGATHGLRPGDVVVAVDGIRVRNFAQYRVARAASLEDVMRLSVWRAGNYLDISAPLRHGWIVSTIRTYDPKTHGSSKP